MKYRQAIFLYRDDYDDFTVWAVDLAENEISEFLSDDSTFQGTLNQVMEHLSITSDGVSDTMHLLEKKGEIFVLYSKDVPYSFIEQHSHEGCSARGNKESIISEIRDCFPDVPIRKEVTDMADNDLIQDLLDSSTVTLGYVYRDGQREKYWFDGTPENIASFLMRFPDADQIILTDRMDMLVLNTIGTFIDTCPDKERLSQVLTHLAPMQMGGAEPKEIFCPSDQEVNDYCNQLSQYDMTFS